MRRVVHELCERGHQVVALVHEPAVEFPGMAHERDRHDRASRCTGHSHLAQRRTARLVFLSTGAVYGTPETQPIGEGTALAPMNPYGASKAAAEQIIGWQAGHPGA